jgi:hypothetical protein
MTPGRQNSVENRGLDLKHPVNPDIAGSRTALTRLTSDYIDRLTWG